MQPTCESLLNAALNLTEDDRARLVDLLLDSIHGPPDPQIEAAWVEESQRRLDAFDAGKARAIPADEAIRSIRAQLDQRRRRGS